MDVDQDDVVVYEPVIQYLNDHKLSIVNLVNVMLTEKKYKTHSLTNNLLANGEKVICGLLGHARLPECARDAVCAAVERIYAGEIETLVDEESGFHFGAQHVVPTDVEDFGLADISKDYMKLAPRTCSLLDALLKARKRRASSLLVPSGINIAEQWQLPDGDRDEERLEGGRQRSGSHLPEENRSEALLRIVRALTYPYMC